MIYIQLTGPGKLPGGGRSGLLRFLELSWP